MKRKLIVSLISAFLIVVMGITFAFFSYTNTSEKNELITGQIYMHYNETKNLVLINAFPESKEKALSRTKETGAVFEFTIDGLNTSDQDIIYDIRISEGPKVDDRTYAINKEHIMIYLECDGEVLIDGMTYDDWDNRRIWVDRIPGGTTEELVKKYELRMWVDENVTISDTNVFADYTTSIWNDSYASLLVSVNGNFEEKTVTGTMRRLGTGIMSFWESSIDTSTVKNSITEVNFLKLSKEEINTRSANAEIVSDLSVNVDYPVKAWLEPNATDSTKNTMYIASNERIYLPSNSSYMFFGFKNLETINFNNIDTSYVTDMSALFFNCNNLKDLDVSSFNTSKTTKFTSMFYGCSSLTNLDLSNFKTEKVTNMSGMFNICTNLSNLNLSSFNTQNVTTMRRMFQSCKNLSVLDISNFTFNQITDNYNYQKIFTDVGTSLTTGTYTTVYVGEDYVLDGTTYSPQNWVLNLSTTNRPTDWTTSNVIVK